MILPFSTQLNGKPTYFVEKIQKGLREIPHTGLTHLAYVENLPSFQLSYYQKCKPKLHTIRKDIKDRWNVGSDIHFYINNRQPDMFLFAPIIKVKSIQEIFMTWNGCNLEATIDDKYMYLPDFDKLVVNDGFESYEDFKNYFITQMDEKGCFSGIIIHWTDLKY